MTILLLFIIIINLIDYNTILTNLFVDGEWISGTSFKPVLLAGSARMGRAISRSIVEESETNQIASSTIHSKDRVGGIGWFFK